MVRGNGVSDAAREFVLGKDCNFLIKKTTGGREREREIREHSNFDGQGGAAIM